MYHCNHPAALVVYEGDMCPMCDLLVHHKATESELADSDRRLHKLATEVTALRSIVDSQKQATQ